MNHKNMNILLRYNDHTIYTYQHPTSSSMGESISVKLCMNFVMHTVIINICKFFKNIYYKCKFFLILYSLSPNRSDVIFYICVYFMCQVNCMSLKFDMNTKYGKKKYKIQLFTSTAGNINTNRPVQ